MSPSGEQAAPGKLRGALPAAGRVNAFNYKSAGLMPQAALSVVG